MRAIIRKGCFKEDDKWQFVVGSDFITIWECERSCKFYPELRLASGFKVTKSTRTITLQDEPLLNVISDRQYSTAEVTILLREYPRITKNSNFKCHFLKNGSSYRREILHDNLEDQTQWHISNLCLLY